MHPDEDVEVVEPVAEPGYYPEEEYSEEEHPEEEPEEPV